MSSCCKSDEKTISSSVSQETRVVRNYTYYNLPPHQNFTIETERSLSSRKVKFQPSFYLDHMFRQAFKIVQYQKSRTSNECRIYTDEIKKNPHAMVSVGIDIVCYGAYTAKMAYVITNEDKSSDDYYRNGPQLDIVEAVEDHIGNLKYNDQYSQQQKEFVEMFQALMRSSFLCFGKRWSELSPQEKECPANLGFKLVEKDQLPHLVFDEEKSEYYPLNQLISRFFLYMLKTLCVDIEENDGKALFPKNFNRLCVTLPSDFHSYQRLALKECLDMLGLEDYLFVNKSTSLTLPFLTKDLSDSSKKFVIDFGSGYMNCSLVQLTGSHRLQVIDQFAEKSISSSQFFESCLKSLRADKSASSDTQARYDLYTTMNVEENKSRDKVKETWKINTGKTSIDINMKKIGGEKLANMVIEKLKKTNLMDPKSGKIKDDIHDVLICSDAVIYEFLERLISNYSASCNVTFMDNDCASVGAAYLASDALNIETHDMVPFPIGIGLYNGVVRFIIDSKTNFPCSGAHMFQTIVDDQTTIRFSLYEGQSPLARNCKHICEIIVVDLNPAPLGETTVEISIDIDQNGVINAYAVDSKTRQQYQVFIDINSVDFLRFKRDLRNTVASIDQKIDSKHQEQDRKLSTVLEELDFYMDHLWKSQRKSSPQDKAFLEKRILLAKKYLSRNRLKVTGAECVQIRRELEEPRDGSRSARSKSSGPDTYRGDSPRKRPPTTVENINYQRSSRVQQSSHCNVL